MALSWLHRALIKFQTVAFVAAIVALAASRASAGLPWAESRTISSANGKFLLVLIAPADARNLSENPPGSSPTAEDIREWRESRRKERQIEAYYPQSGLYRNDGSKDLLWPIHYLTICKDIYVSNDGKHLITAVFDWETTCSDRGHAVEFYADGQQIAFYDEYNLLVGYLLRRLLSNAYDAEWPTCVAATLDDGAKTFEIATNWGDTFRFDISTGKLVASSLPPAFWTALISVVFLVASLGWWIGRKMSRERAR